MDCHIGQFMAIFSLAFKASYCFVQRKWLLIGLLRKFSKEGQTNGVKHQKYTKHVLFR